MKKQSSRKFLVLMLLSLSLIRCTPTPPDVPVCENLEQHLGTDPVTKHLILKPSPTCMKQLGEPECGHCTWIMSKKEAYVGEGAKFLLSGKKWSQIKAESIYVPAIESYSPIAQYIINSCEKMNCSDQVDLFKVKIDSLNGISAVIQQNAPASP